MSGPVSSVSPFPAATSADLNAHTIQALVELVYCQTANDVLVSAMSSLQQALATTQNALSTLTTIQNLKNSMKPDAKSTFDFDYANGGSDYEEEYNSAASAFFGEPIVPLFYIGNDEVSAGSPEFDDFVDKLKEVKSSLAIQIAFLSTITDTNDPNTLYAKLKTVYNDLPSSYSFGNVKDWVIDNYDAQGTTAIANAGNLQQHITDAITAGQSLNSSQQQKIQNYLFIFQQYYQSAAAVLTALQQIIDRMAQAAGR